MAQILVVDDEEQIRESLRQILVAAGHQVMEAADGQVAVDIVKGFTPDLVILDILMPNQEGLETILLLRRLAPPLKILAMSGGGQYVGVDILVAAQHLGANLAISKPFSRQTVLTAIQALCP